MGHTPGSIQEIKDEAERLTKQRLANDGIGDHEAREAEVNAMEGVTAGTPLLEAVKANPSEPGMANVQSLAAHKGPKNVHATGNLEPTASSVKSAEQSALKGTNTTDSKDPK